MDRIEIIYIKLDSLRNKEKRKKRAQISKNNNYEDIKNI